MTQIKDGALYKVFEIEGVRFEIFYGYETEAEKQNGWEPSPLYPDFARRPQYTKGGHPFTLAYGGPCPHYRPLNRDADDEWCANCPHFDQREEFVGLCKSPHRVRKNE